MFADITVILWEQPWGWHVFFSAVNLNENAWNVATRPSPASHSLSAHAVFAIFSVQSTIFAFSLCIKYLLYDMLCLKTFAAHMQCNALISVLHLQCDELEVIATLYFVIATLLYFVGSCQGNAIGFYYLSIIYISLTLFLCNLSFRNVHCSSNYHIIFFKF